MKTPQARVEEMEQQLKKQAQALNLILRRLAFLEQENSRRKNDIRRLKP